MTDRMTVHQICEQGREMGIAANEIKTVLINHHLSVSNKIFLLDMLVFQMKMELMES